MAQFQLAIAFNHRLQTFRLDRTGAGTASPLSPSLTTRLPKPLTKMLRKACSECISPTILISEVP